MTERNIKELMEESHNILQKLINLDDPSKENEFLEYLETINKNQLINLANFIELVNPRILSSDYMSKKVAEKFNTILGMEMEVKRMSSLVDQKSDESDESDKYEIIIKSIFDMLESLIILSENTDNLLEEECCEGHTNIKNLAVEILKCIDLESIKENVNILKNNFLKSEILH